MLFAVAFLSCADRCCWFLFVALSLQEANDAAESASASAAGAAADEDEEGAQRLPKRKREEPKSGKDAKAEPARPEPEPPAHMQIDDAADAEPNRDRPPQVALASNRVADGLLI